MHQHTRAVSPAAAYLDKLTWDGVPRLDTWLTDYLGAKDEPFTRAAGARWMISAVARAYEPGVRADGVLVLIGEPGTGKSSALRVLGGPWLGEVAASDMRSSMFAPGDAWIYEITDLGTELGRPQSSRIKAALSAVKDTVRPMYSRTREHRPRGCVFVATTNDESTAPEFDRRFWPVRCGRIDTESLALVRDSLFAEAVFRYREGEPWWMSSEELRQGGNEAAARLLQPDLRGDLVLVLQSAAGTYAPALRVTIEGPQGCGKSSTAAEVRRFLEQRGHVVEWHDGDEHCTPDSPTAVIRTVQQNPTWETDAARRALDPDCREDLELVLEGKEGSVERLEGEHPDARGSVDR